VTARSRGQPNPLWGTRQMVNSIATEILQSSSMLLNLGSMVLLASIALITIARGPARSRVPIRARRRLMAMRR